MSEKKINVFLREKGLNHDFKLEGSNFNGTLLELLTESASQQPKGATGGAREIFEAEYGVN